MEKGYLALVLHSHLPYVRHPEHDQFLEEDWLYEAITETYIPLLNVFDGLVNDRIDFRITMSLTPTLVSMLTDPLLQHRYLRHIDKLIELAEKEIERTSDSRSSTLLRTCIGTCFTNARTVFEEKYGRNLVTAFKNFQDLGKLEIITCAATHGFLPLMQNSNAVRAQVMVAVEHYKRHFGRPPQGIWLPECGYYDGARRAPARRGHPLLLHRYARGVLRIAPAEVRRLCADLLPARAWPPSAGTSNRPSRSGAPSRAIPGDYNYRDFYRDVGFDLDYEYLKPHLHRTASA